MAHSTVSGSCLCGGPMPRTVPVLDAVLIPAGSLDSEPLISPEHHIIWDSRTDWSCSAQGLPIFSMYPE